MKEFVKEVRRRHVPRFAVLYLIGAWLAIQVATTLFEAGVLPQIVPTAVFYLLVIGFPFALVFAWIFDFDLKKGLIPTSGFAQAEAGSEAAARIQPRIPPEKSIAVLPFAAGAPGAIRDFSQTVLPRKS